VRLGSVMGLMQFFSWIFGVDGRNGMLEVGIVERGAVFACTEGADMSSVQVHVKEVCPFGSNATFVS
jgi:hypothetical protein